jgi:fumarylacetoacetase
MTGSWVPVPDDSVYPVTNLPFGVFSRPGEPPRVGARLGDWVVDLARLDLPHAIELDTPSLNRFLALGPAAWAATRARLIRLLTDPAERPRVEPHLVRLAEVSLHLPVQVADYVDFYSFEQHARNLGSILRPGQKPLPAAWRHLPIGYHGRAGTVVVSGTPVVRPRGLRRMGGGSAPVDGPSLRMDIEAEVGFVVGVPSAAGRRVPAGSFRDHVFGAVLVNDWSARDLQAFEYVPLGPFLGKSFATSISAWVVPLEALEAARVAPPEQDPAPPAYLRDPDPWSLDLRLRVEWNGTTVSHPSFREMYWTPGQQMAHLTGSGACLRTGDLFASGTVSGPERGQWGSFIELSWNGAEPVSLADGSTRSFLEDGDTVTITASAPGPEAGRIGFGEVVGTIRPAVGG